MYKIESDLSSRADINELADFVEILCLRDEHVSKQEIIAILGRVDDNERTSGLDADERLESKIDDIFSELEFRFRISNGKYPFDIDESGHVIYVSNTVEKKYHYLYFYLLLSTRLNMKNNKIQNSIDGTLLFEEVAVEIIRDYLGIKSKSFLFGTSANDSNFKSKIEQLCVEMEEGGGFVQRDNDPPSYVKDDKLDIVAWIPFKDKCTGKLIVFGQCKTGTSYKEELVKLQPDRFCNKWLRDNPAITPLKIYFLTDSLLRGKWYTTSQDAGILFDRCRIMDTVSELSEEVSNKLKSWLDHAVKNHVKN